MDVKGLLQGVDGGHTYNEYMVSHRRSVELEEKIRRLKAQIQTLEQLVTMFTITVATNPTSTTRLGQLQNFTMDKNIELKAKVIIIPSIVHKITNSMISRN